MRAVTSLVTKPHTPDRFPHSLNVSVHNLPRLVSDCDLAGGTVIVVDLLRASTTICVALGAGAECVIPLLEVEHALAMASHFDRDAVILGGERHGTMIKGFDLGNSPLEYLPERVWERKLLFTTTNGTRALLHARMARHVLIGAAVNRAAIAAAAHGSPHVHLLCAGTDGDITGEDILAAGAIVSELVSLPTDKPLNLNLEAQEALRQWKALITSARSLGLSVSEHFASELQDTPGGKNLLAIGHGPDLMACAQLDTLDVVPEWNRNTGRITLR